MTGYRLPRCPICKCKLILTKLEEKLLCKNCNSMFEIRGIENDSKFTESNL